MKKQTLIHFLKNCDFQLENLLGKQSFFCCLRDLQGFFHFVAIKNTVRIILIIMKERERDEKEKLFLLTSWSDRKHD